MIYNVGVDGGGTKTECILVDGAGRIVARHLAPGCNPSISGPVQAKRIATQALAALRQQLPRKPAGRTSSPPKSAVALTLLCMAGPLEFWRDFAEGLRGFGRVLAADDSLPVLELATRGWPGLVLHAGTGSFVAARVSAGSKSLEQRLGDARYAGGLGWRFGDEGSGYDIGRRAVARALLEIQGWEVPSRLSNLVRDQMGRGDASAIARHFYDDPKANARIAALTPAVLRLASEDEPVALALVIESVGGLLDLAVKVAARLFPAIPPSTVRAGVSGPILTHPAILSELKARSPLAIHAVQGAPIEGVRRLLLGASQAA
jgi:N-acetylglucosamine kinase-like BadF-type ATPase